MSRKTFKLSITYFVIIIFGCCINLLCGKSTHAALVPDNDLYKLSLLSGLEQCYQFGIKDEIQLSDFSGFGSILNKNGNTVNITTHIGNSLSGNSDNDLKCSELIGGYRTNKGSNSANGIKQIFKDAATPEDAGYYFAKSDQSNTSNTKKYTISDFQGNTSRLKVTFKGELEVSGADTNDATCAGEITAYYGDIYLGSAMCPNGKVIISSSGTSGVSAPYDQIYPYMRSFDEIKDNLYYNFMPFVYNYSTYNEYGEQIYPFINDTNEITVSMKDVGESDSSSQLATYKPIDNTPLTDAEIAINKLGIDGSLSGCSIGALYTGGVEYPTTSCRFNTATTYSLYYRYVQNQNGLQIQECATDKNASATYSLKNKSDQWCAIAISDPSALNESYSINDGKGRLKDGTMQDILSWLNDENSYTYLKDNQYADATVNENGVAENTTNETTPAENDPCYNAGDSLGWWLCPTMNMIGDALGDLYENVVEPFLQMDTNSVENGRGAWETVLGIANTLLIIFFMVVIFSQLTGVGIDNYGIKKILPKIIVVGVLINLSFIICQLAVDLSNIAGASFQKFFTDMAGNIPIDAETASTLASADNPSATWFKTLFTTISGGVVVLGGASVVSSALNGGLINGILIPVLLAFIVALIAVLFFFILLGARKAGIIILIVIAPLAFVCYMLPNTKKYFDKWWKAFSGLLLVYPLCGVLLGGSQFASRLIINSSTDYIMYFVGAMLLVVPYFFVPTLLKGSFAALGNLGAKISGFGQKFGQRTRGRADNTIKNSNRYKARQTDAAFRTQRRQDNLNRRRSDRVVNRYGSRNPSSLNERQRLALLNAQRTQARLNSQEQKDYSDQFANISDIPTMQSTLNAALARGNSNEIAAALAVAESKGMESQIFSALRSSPSAVMNNSAVMAQLAQSKNKVLRAYGKKGSGVDYNTFLTGTGSNSLSGYAASKGEGFLDGLDDKALEEMANHGGANALTNSMLMKAAASAKDQSSVDAIDKMFAGRTFSQNDFTAENISQFKESTVRSIMASGSANATALAAASDSLANNPQNAQLVARMDGATKARLNTLRRTLGRTVIT